MSAGKRKFRRRMIKLGTGPRIHVVTAEAIMAETRLRVPGTRRGGEVLRVTAETVCRRARVSISGMALGEGDSLGRAGQHERGELRVVEPGTRPAVHVVTAVACRRQFG